MTEPVTTKFSQTEQTDKADVGELKSFRLNRVGESLKNVARDIGRGVVHIGREAAAEFVRQIKPVAAAVARQALMTAAHRTGDYLTEKINNSTLPRRPATRSVF
ncbi:MAG: hypothetical protein EA357_11690 [Micavibrio sp.]|jgi:hypothetical protein|nr:MAG: hypothetical protein EA357_11690 [Micavibrio sp.]